MPVVVLILIPAQLIEVQLIELTFEQPAHRPPIWRSSLSAIVSDQGSVNLIEANVLATFH